jgi:hypothetical protein
MSSCDTLPEVERDDHDHERSSGGGQIADVVGHRQELHCDEHPDEPRGDEPSYEALAVWMAKPIK